MATSSKHWFSELLKDRFVKTVFKIIISLIAFFLFFIVTRAVLGYNVNFFGIETNPDNKKSKEPEVVSKPTTPALVDTPVTKTIIKEQPKFVISTSERKKTDIKKPVTIVQNIDSGGSGVQNNGNNNGQQAGRDINNIGIIPRKITEADLLPYINQLPDKTISVRFVSYGFADAEINSVKNQIITIMKKHGFINIENTFHIKIGTEPPKSIIPAFFQKENILEFHIPPAEL